MKAPDNGNSRDYDPYGKLPEDVRKAWDQALAGLTGIDERFKSSPPPAGDEAPPTDDEPGEPCGFDPHGKLPAAVQQAFREGLDGINLDPPHVHGLHMQRLGALHRDKTPVNVVRGNGKVVLGTIKAIDESNCKVTLSYQDEGQNWGKIVPINTFLQWQE